MSEETQTYKIFITEEEEEKDLTRVDIVELLYNDVATVTFTKKDGTERVMLCTLHKDILKDRLPELDDEEEFEERDRLGGVWDAGRKVGVINEDSTDKSTYVATTGSTNNIVVFDIQKQDWRSFRIDSVKSIGFPNTIHTDSGTVYPTILQNRLNLNSHEEEFQGPPDRPPPPPSHITDTPLK
jgi:hypothetical protein